MIESIEDKNEKLDTKLQMRIEIHIGTIEGVTGSNIVRHDIYGSTVKVSNKMESNGQPGRINIGQPIKEMFQHLDKDLLFQFKTM